MKTRRIVLGAAVVAVVVAALWGVPRIRRLKAALRHAVRIEPEASQASYLCYFPTGEGLDLVEESRQAPKAESPADRVRILVTELGRGPAAAGSLPVLPEDAAPRTVFLASDGTAYIDFPRSALEQASGPREEFLLVRAIARTLIRNCPEVRAFVVLADGAPAGTVVMHFPARGKYLLPQSRPARPK